MAKYWVGVRWDRLGAVCVEAADEDDALVRAAEVATGLGCTEQSQSHAFVEEDSEWSVDEFRVWQDREVV